MGQMILNPNLLLYIVSNSNIIYKVSFLDILWKHNFSSSIMIDGYKLYFYFFIKIINILKQAELTGKRLENEIFEKIYCSDLDRAK